MDISQLPRDDSGVVVGRWRLRHRIAGFTESFGPFGFQDGVSTAPLTGLALERAVASLGELVDVEPWDQAQDKAHAPDPPIARAAEEPGLPTGGATPGAVTPTPTTLTELKALGEADLRAVAVELGCADKRWKPERLRRFIAAELELGMEEDDASTE